MFCSYYIVQLHQWHGRFSDEIHKANLTNSTIVDDEDHRFVIAEH